MLKEMKSRLDEKGWIKGNLETEDGYCLLGVAWEVLGNGLTDPEDQQEFSTLMGVIAEQYPEFIEEDGYISIMKFNDDVATTRRDIDNVIDKAITKVEEL